MPATTLRWHALAAALIAVLMAGCATDPKLPQAGPAPIALRAASASAPASAAAVHKTVARRVEVVGPRGRMNQAERETLMKQLSAEGSASLLRRQLVAMVSFGDVDLVAGNQTRLLIDGPATFAAKFKAIEAARDSILVESYIVEDASIARRFAEALSRKASQGVRVALIYDAIGSIGTDAAYFDDLRRAGVQVCAFNPPTSARERKSHDPTERDHRKVVVVDAQVGFVGGVNISSVYASGSFGSRRARAAVEAEGGWRDTHLELRGPVAAKLDELVRDTWRDQGCEGELRPPKPVPKSATPAGNDVVRVVPTQPDDDHSRLYAQLMTAFDTATRSIHLTAAYFAPGDEMIDALCQAAQRGVDVQLILPSRSDFKPVLHAGRARYEQLLAAGVRIHEFQDAVLHAKTAVIDGVWSTVGSSNLDYRSFVANNEINVVVLGEDFGNEMERVFRRDLAASQPISPQQWSERRAGDRVLEQLAKLLERWW